MRRGKCQVSNAERQADRLGEKHTQKKHGPMTLHSACPLLDSWAVYSVYNLLTKSTIQKNQLFRHLAASHPTFLETTNRVTLNGG
jgi:hypothetical protein